VDQPFQPGALNIVPQRAMDRPGRFAADPYKMNRRIAAPALDHAGQHDEQLRRFAPLRCAGRRHHWRVCGDAQFAAQLRLRARPDAERRRPVNEIPHDGDMRGRDGVRGLQIMRHRG
jgi:hypothetical protein